MIVIGSRYEREEVFYTLDARSGSTRPTVMRSATNPSRYAPPSKAVKWQSGIRLDQISGSRWGSPDRWWVLADANPDLLDPMSLTPGATILLP